jgi:hypothetical protein
MFHQYLSADAYQDDACPQLGTEVHALPEEHANEASQYGEQE